jgi:galactose mutarotase-like enzyme
MIQLEHDLLRISIAEKGAELQSLFRTDLRLEYLWSGDPAFWGKFSPVLFPIVGGLKDNTYFYKGQAYQLGRHGFARDMEFSVQSQSNKAVVLVLNSNEATKKVYPFDFSFELGYLIQHDTLTVSYTIINTGKETLYASVGAHPAFKIPLTDGTKYEDWYLEFAQTEHTGKWPLTKEGLIEAAPIPCLENTNVLALNKPLFYGDALVFKDLQSTAISIKSKQSTHGLSMQFEGFPYYGIWAAKDADFVCLEPWCGIADNATTNQELTNKEGIHAIEQGSSFIRSWSVQVF